MLSFRGPKGVMGRRGAQGAALLLVGLASLPAGAAPPPLELGNGVRLALVEVPAGTFVQGSAAAEPGHGADEGRREVRISQAFWIGRAPVTVGQFRRFAEEAGYVIEAEKGSSGGFGWDGTKLAQRKEFTWRSPGFVQTDEHPVVIVTYGDAEAFAAWVGRRTGLTVRLPTEAEWEMAARGGSKARFFWGNDETQAEQKVWFAKNAGKGAMPVGTKAQNEWGIQDPAGNVWQWCLDFHGPISGDAATDPQARSPVTWEHSDKPRRVLKGGSWLTNDRWKLRPAARNRATDGSRNADFGFRIVAMPGVAREPAATPPPGAPPSSTPGSGGPAPAAVSESGAMAIGCGAIGCGAVFFLGVVFLIVRALVKGVRGPGGSGGVAPSVQVRPATDGFWLVTSAAAPRAQVSYAVRTPTRATSGSVMVEPGPQGTFVYTGEPAIDVRVTGVTAVMGGASAGGGARSWSSGSSRREDSWSSSRREDSWSSNDSSSSSSWPSAY